MAFFVVYSICVFFSVFLVFQFKIHVTCDLSIVLHQPHPPFPKGDLEKKATLFKSSSKYQSPVYHFMASRSHYEQTVWTSFEQAFRRTLWRAFCLLLIFFELLTCSSDFHENDVGQPQTDNTKKQKQTKESNILTGYRLTEKSKKLRKATTNR